MNVHTLDNDTHQWWKQASLALHSPYPALSIHHCHQVQARIFCRRPWEAVKVVKVQLNALYFPLYSVEVIGNISGNWQGLAGNAADKAGQTYLDSNSPCCALGQPPQASHRSMPLQDRSWTTLHIQSRGMQSRSFATCSSISCSVYRKNTWVLLHWEIDTLTHTLPTVIYHAWSTMGNTMEDSLAYPREGIKAKAKAKERRKEREEAKQASQGEWNMNKGSTSQGGREKGTIRQWEMQQNANMVLCCNTHEWGGHCLLPNLGGPNFKLHFKCVNY